MRRKAPSRKGKKKSKTSSSSSSSSSAAASSSSSSAASASAGAGAGEQRVTILLGTRGHLETLWRPAAVYSDTITVYSLVSSCSTMFKDQHNLWRAHKRSVGVAGKVLELFRAHDNQIYDLAWIPFAADAVSNGDALTRPTARGYLATCGIDHKVKLWHVATCCDPTWSPEGEASSAWADPTWGDDDPEIVRITAVGSSNVRTQTRQLLVGHAEEVRSVTPLFPPNLAAAGGRGGGLTRAPKFLMASCSNDKSLRVWDPWAGGGSLRQLGGCIDHVTNEQSKLGHENKVLCLTHLPVHGYIATGGADKVIMLWRLPAGYSETLTKAKRGGGGRSSSSGGGDGAKQKPLFDYPLAETLPEEVRPTTSAAAKGSWSRAEPQQVAKGVKQKHEFERDCFLGKLEGHRDSVTCIVAVPNHGCSDRSPHRREYMASGSDDKSVFLWDFSSTPPERVRKLRQHTDAISCLAVLPPTLHYIPVPADILGSDSKYVAPFAYNGEGAPPQQLLLASGAHDGSVRVWDLLSGKHIRDYRVGVGGISRAWVMTLAVYPTRLKGETLIVSGHEDKTIRIWSLEEERIVRTIPGQHDEVSTLAILPGGLIAIGSADGTLRIIA